MTKRSLRETLSSEQGLWEGYDPTYPIVSFKYINRPPGYVADKRILHLEMPSIHLLLLLWICAYYLQQKFSS